MGQIFNLILFFVITECSPGRLRGYVNEWKKRSEKTQQIGALKMLYNRMTKNGNLDVDALNKKLDQSTQTYLTKEASASILTSLCAHALWEVKAMTLRMTLQVVRKCGRIGSCR